MGVREPVKSILFYLCICSHVCTEEWELTLLHTNDVHARVEETSKDSGKCTKPPCFAGVARRFTKIQEIRSREKNVMLLDAGDQFQGTVWFNVYKGAEAAYFMNKLGYDAMVSSLHHSSRILMWATVSFHDGGCSLGDHISNTQMRNNRMIRHDILRTTISK